MNLLVTNSHGPQAYAIIRALKPYAQKIVTTMYGKNRLTARLSHAANSRLVDKHYYVPSPLEDWQAGNIGIENTEREETYIQAVERICQDEKIDTLFPSWDPQVYVFSKNKARFERMGVLIPVPDYEVVVNPLDKYRTIRAAEESGFPCPKTYLPEREEDLSDIGEEVGFPLVIKPRFNSGGHNMEFVQDLPGLLQKAREVKKNRGSFIIQEYIPGKEKPALYLLCDKEGNAQCTLAVINLRTFPRVSLQFPTAAETIEPVCLTQAIKLAKRLGFWGGITLEIKIDSRDGIPKLMEINPRLGMRLWERTELGINEPLMCLNVARGKGLESVKNHGPGTLLLEPIEDLLVSGYRVLDLLNYRLRTVIRGESPIDRLNSPMTLKEMIRSYKQTYFSHKKKVFNPYLRYFFQDPLVSILWWLQFTTWVWGGRKQLGR